MKINQKKGFTLIEILVVISIIAFLVSFSVVTLSDSRQKARDTKRYSDLNALTKAISMYHLDNGFYPIADTIGADDFEYSHNHVDNFIEVLLTDEHMNVNLVDPVNLEANGQYYFYGSFPAGSGTPGNECNEDLGDYYILGVTDLEKFLDADRPNPKNFDLSCGFFEFVQNNDYFTGNFEGK